MQPVDQLIKRRWRLRLHMATAGLSLALWLFMAVAEEYPALHAWLHGGTIPDNDDCAVVAIAHGTVQTVACDAPLVVVSLSWVEITARTEFPAFSPAIAFLRNGRAPPAPFVVC